MSKVHLVPQHVNINELPHIFLPLVGRERRVAPIGGQLCIAGVEFLAYFCKLDLDAVRLLLLAFRVAEVGYEVVQAAGLGGHN